MAIRRTLTMILVFAVLALLNVVFWIFALDMWELSRAEHPIMILSLIILTNIMALACTLLTFYILRRFVKMSFPT